LGYQSILPSSRTCSSSSVPFVCYAKRRSAPIRILVVQCSMPFRARSGSQQWLVRVPLQPAMLPPDPVGFAVSGFDTFLTGSNRSLTNVFEGVRMSTERSVTPRISYSRAFAAAPSKPRNPILSAACQPLTKKVCRRLVAKPSSASQPLGLAEQASSQSEGHAALERCDLELPPREETTRLGFHAELQV
jgi:hypothetical protein